MPSERRLAAILFTDIVGYTALMAESEERGLAARRRHRELVRPLVGVFSGELIEARRDESLSIFPSALEAVNCALAIEDALQGESDLRLHIGIHLGDIVVDKGEVSGDGVNLASLICALSEGGGICISGQVYDAIRNRPEIEATSLGEHDLKNVGRPVHVYSIVRGAAAGAVPELEDRPRRAVRWAVAGAALVVIIGVGTWWYWPRTLDLYQAPTALAALPFDNFTGDPEMEQLALGIPEDLLTRLAVGARVLAISRNTSFQFKGQEVCKAARRMTARFVMEGSVRKVGDRLRITAQLIECPQDTHIWVETYDRGVEDVFALQEEVAGRIAVSSRSVIRSRLEDASGFFSHLDERTREDSARALAIARTRAEQAPDAVQRSWWLQWVVLTDLQVLTEGWSDSPLETVEEMSRAARRCVWADPQFRGCWMAAGYASMAAGEQDEAIKAFEREVALSKGLPDAHGRLGQALTLAGRSDEAIASLEEAMRLSPDDPDDLRDWLTGMAAAHFAAERYEEAADWAQRVLCVNDPRTYKMADAHLYLAASYTYLGRLEEARAALKEAKQLRLELSRTLSEGWPMLSVWDPDSRDRYLDGLRVAGLEE